MTDKKEDMTHGCYHNVPAHFTSGSEPVKDTERGFYHTGPADGNYGVVGYPKTSSDTINHPSHYTSRSHGIECIEITRRCDFCKGNAIKYVWRHMEKGKPVEDLKKALWYLDYCGSKSCGWISEMVKIEAQDPFGSIIAAIYYGEISIAKKLIKERIEML